MFFFLLSLSSPFQHQMESWNVFSILGIVKVDKCSRLTNESLDDLLVLKSGSTPLAAFNANPSIDLWWSAKARRPRGKSIGHAVAIVHQRLEYKMTPVKVRIPYRGKFSYGANFSYISYEASRYENKNRENFNRRNFNVKF